MKVIYAGFSKCGTKSMAAALRQLGYRVCDFLDNYESLRDAWTKVFSGEATAEDFFEMFKDFDAVTDVPGVYFWEEIHRAFPEAKVVFCTRRTEDEWYKSFVKQIHSSDSFIEKLIPRLSPTYHRFNGWMETMLATVFRKPSLTTLFSTVHINELRCRMIYRRHNVSVLKNVPADKLLVFNFADGWQPLCEFLQVAVPGTPFPHKNKNANLKNELESPVISRINQEVIGAMVLIAGVSSFTGYKLYCNRVSASAAVAVVFDKLNQLH